MKTKKPKRGRPPKPHDERLSVALNVRITDETYAALCDAVEADGEQASRLIPSYVRRLVERHLRGKGLI
jgi:hypothetical protein